MTRSGRELRWDGGGLVAEGLRMHQGIRERRWHLAWWPRRRVHVKGCRPRGRVGIDVSCGWDGERSIRPHRLTSTKIGHILILIARTSNPHPRHQRFVWRVMKILGLLPHPIMAGILQSPFDTSLTRPFISCESSDFRLSSIRCGCFQKGGERRRRGCLQAWFHLLTTGQVGSLAGIAGPSSFLPPGPQRILGVGAFGRGIARGRKTVGLSMSVGKLAHLSSLLITTVLWRLWLRLRMRLRLRPRLRSMVSCIRDHIIFLFLYSSIEARGNTSPYSVSNLVPNPPTLPSHAISRDCPVDPRRL